jgi:hypothetical protein
MIAKIGLTAAFLLMIAPPMESASNRTALDSASRDSAIVVAQNGQASGGTAENGNDGSNGNPSSDSASDNQNSNVQQNDAGNDLPMAPQVLNGPDNDPDSAPQFDQAPQPQPVNPYQ